MQTYQNQQKDDQRVRRRGMTHVQEGLESLSRQIPFFPGPCWRRPGDFRTLYPISLMLTGRAFGYSTLN